MWAEVKTRAQEYSAGSVDWKSSLLPMWEQERGLTTLAKDGGTVEGRDHRMLIAFQPCFPQDQHTTRHTIILSCSHLTQSRGPRYRTMTWNDFSSSETNSSKTLGRGDHN